jgi:altronate hydrolase
VIARHQLVGGTRLADEGVTVAGLIPPGHKVAVRPIAAGAPVRRYNQIIGTAKTAIAPGQHVHTHNLEFSSFARDYAAGQGAQPTQYVDTPATFDGIVRADGRIATRNYVGILTSVNCSATVARAIADHFRRDTNPMALARYPNVDGVVALTHAGGCATDSAGEPLQVLRRTLGGYARHPNFASILVVGLGCETNQISGLMEQESLATGTALHAFNIQETGGTRKTSRTASSSCSGCSSRRTRSSASRSRPATSSSACNAAAPTATPGISANPALGAAVDRLVRHGGTAILSETPEIYGGEHLLTRRAASTAIADKLIERIRWWERYTERNDQEMDNNPSAGNKAGGLTTILEKSLGAIAKSGTTNLTDVFEYAQPVTTKGLVFMDTPGYDPVSATGQVAGGAQPDLLHDRARLGLRLCAVTVAEAQHEHRAVGEAGRRHRHQLRRGDRRHRVDRRDGRADLQLMLETASGTKTKSEIHGYGPERIRAVVARRGDVKRSRPLRGTFAPSRKSVRP